MKIEDIKFQETTLPKGIRAILSFGDYELSIVKNDFSYGGKQGLFEIMTIRNGDQTELPGITAPGDTVKGFLQPQELQAIILKMQTFTGVEPSQNQLT